MNSYWRSFTAIEEHQDVPSRGLEAPLKASKYHEIHMKPGAHTDSTQLTSPHEPEVD